ncbi:hypothetical protein DYB26_010602 [Aphanomyces astaci]|uniref:Uncharacterized protein n=1 Tax=Aphanomyces astaci TaxID=112090 RepID=A0A397FC47_APHAT|nr:hypothetical protein DYB26_010602 [Aphanomyces astaci]RHZ25753.1 hypothetical protein DYB31_006657 [Aphanomyces astaci]
MAHLRSVWYQLTDERGNPYKANYNAVAQEKVMIASDCYIADFEDAVLANYADPDLEKIPCLWLLRTYTNAAAYTVNKSPLARVLQLQENLGTKDDVLAVVIPDDVRQRPPFAQAHDHVAQLCENILRNQVEEERRRVESEKVARMKVKRHLNMIELKHNVLQRWQRESEQVILSTLKRQLQRLEAAEAVMTAMARSTTNARVGEEDQAIEDNQHHY